MDTMKVGQHVCHKLLVTAVTFLVALVDIHAANAVTLYVSPAGRHEWSGLLAEPNVDQSDGPLPSIQAARDLIRSRRAEGKWLDGQVTVYLRGGTYFLSEPLSFESQDSGTKDKPITYAAFESEEPVISGGRVIAGWKNRLSTHRRRQDRPA